ncbi:MAG: SAM-dependent methyltransferase [Verrucomicrobiota bacterium]
MSTALYHPTLGYYARGTRQTGKSGDFFTSVSVGPLFGNLLAWRFLRHWRESGKPTRWRIIECGAHDGTLTNDVLGTLWSLDAQAFEGLEYVIPEPLPSLQAAQRKTLDHFDKHVRILSNVAELADQPLPGIAFGNELLDALPFHVVECQNSRWLECTVALTAGDQLVWKTREIDDPELLEALEPLGNGFPDGYRTEVRTGIRQFLAPIARALDCGLMIWIDYGFARPEYYHPARSSGTLRTFSQHRAGEDPLNRPGESDITAHVDFTAIAEWSTSLGGRPLVFQNQGSWLTDAGRDWLLEQEGIPKNPLLRQFQTLTHPAHLGGRFHVLEISWNPKIHPPDPPSLQHRLFGTTK